MTVPLILLVLIGPLVLCDTFWLDLAQLEGISNYWPVAMGWWRASEQRNSEESNDEGKEREGGEAAK